MAQVAPDVVPRLAALALAAGLPAVAYLAIVRWLDRYDREPGYLVAAAFFWGGTGAICFGVFFSLAFLIPSSIAFGAESGKVLGTVVFAPITEEVGKGLFLFAIAFHDQFDGLVDGMVYGAAVGLGFAAVENFGYFLGAETPEHLVVLICVRTGYTMVGHGVATSCTGAALGYAKFSSQHWLLRGLAVVAGLGVAMLLHALGNFLCVLSAGAKAPVLVLFAFLGLVVALGFHLIVMQVALQTEAQILAEELAAEAEVVPPALAALVGSYFLRLRHLAWLFVTLRWGAAVRFQRLCRSATQLALKRHQARQRPDLNATVAGLRAEAAGLIQTGWR